ncbi:hypothetical protein J6590_053785 [Homalodisca vitripennis]|nr:hypothetical protein J6590_053785 [Homalodisca vitripennis]
MAEDEGLTAIDTEAQLTGHWSVLGPQTSVGFFHPLTKHLCEVTIPSTVESALSPRSHSTFSGLEQSTAENVMILRTGTVNSIRSRAGVLHRTGWRTRVLFHHCCNRALSYLAANARP